MVELAAFANYLVGTYTVAQQQGSYQSLVDYYNQQANAEFAKYQKDRTAWHEANRHKPLPQCCGCGAPFDGAEAHCRYCRLPR